MEKEIKSLLEVKNLDYGDVRYEKNEINTISLENEKLKDIKSSYREGGHLRLFKNGRKVVNSFTSFDDARRIRDSLLLLAEKSARLDEEKKKLKEAPTYQDEVEVEVDSDPRDYSLSDKKELLEKYNRLALRQEKVIKTEFKYNDFYSRRTFINSQGTEIKYELLGSYIYGQIYARQDDVVQTKRVKFGAYPEFSNLLNREEAVEENVDILQQMLAADPISAGSYPVVVNPELGSVFIHEAFGHLSEADGIENNPEFREKLKMGKQLGDENLNVIDDPTISQKPGSYVYDDEGQKGERTELIKNGKLNGRLHSRATAESFSESISGNMRAVDCHYTPLIRMSNIFIAAGEHKVEELFNSIEDGYYLLNSRGGQTTGDQFTFGAEYGYQIKNGEKEKMVRDINLSGELFNTLENISLIADDLTFAEVGGCGKGSPMQLNMFSGKGSPHVKIQNVTIGGK